MLQALVSRSYARTDLDVLSALGGTRTPNLLIRSQMLYPIELQALGDAPHRQPVILSARQTGPLSCIPDAVIAPAVAARSG
jgi:hypothetical protein